MLVTFKSQAEQDIYDGISSKQSRRVPLELHGKIRRLFDQLDAAAEIDDLRVPPGNRLEKLKGRLDGKWSVRINVQWRIIFSWDEQGAHEVEVIDYHA